MCKDFKRPKKIYRGHDLRVIPGHTCSGDTVNIDP